MRRLRNAGFDRTGGKGLLIVPAASRAIIALFEFVAIEIHSYHLSSMADKNPSATLATFREYPFRPSHTGFDGELQPIFETRVAITDLLDSRQKLHDTEWRYPHLAEFIVYVVMEDEPDDIGTLRHLFVVVLHLLIFHHATAQRTVSAHEFIDEDLLLAARAYDMMCIHTYGRVTHPLLLLFCRWCGGKAPRLLLIRCRNRRDIARIS